MSPSRFVAVLAAASALACATGKSAEGPKLPRGGRLHVAGEPMPVPNVMPEGEIRERYREALLAEQRAREADDAGRKPEARQLYAQAADAFLAFANKYAGNNWDEAFRYHAATLYDEAGRLPQAVATAETLAESTKDPMSRALAWLVSANARVKAKDLQPPRIVPLEDRKGPVTPREPPSVWRSFTDAAREAVAAAEPQGAAEPPKRTMSPAQLALIAGQAEFALDRMEPARGLLDAAVARSAGEPEVFAAAAQLYLRTWADQGDLEGYRAALDKLRGVAEAHAKAAPASSAKPTPGADTTGTGSGEAKPEEGAAKDPVAAVSAADLSIRFGLGRRMVNEGKFAEAASAFEALAKEQGADAATALDAAAFAHEKAGDGKKAAALREQVLAEHPDSEVAPVATLGLASLRSKLGDHKAAAKLYETYLTRWPDGQQRCAALRNSAIAADQGEQWVDAAKRYQRFATDADCTKASADAALLAQYRAGRLYDYIGKKAEAKAAYRDALTVEGASSAEAQQALADAKKRAK